MMGHMKDKIIGIILHKKNLGFPNWDSNNSIIVILLYRGVPEIPLGKEIGPSQAPTTV